jgi:hypothetical protein
MIGLYLNVRVVDTDEPGPPLGVKDALSLTFSP